MKKKTNQAANKPLAMDDEQLESVVGGVGYVNAALDSGINSHKDNPLGGVAAPMGGVAAPMGGVAAPMSGVDNPMSGVDNPMSGVDNPMSGVDNPSGAVADPNAHKIIL